MVKKYPGITPEQQLQLMQFIAQLSKSFDRGKEAIKVHIQKEEEDEEFDDYYEPDEEFSEEESEEEEQAMNDAFTLPRDVFMALTKLVMQGADQAFQQGNGIPEELTTQDAADLLNVSRPFVIRLLESGKIPFHKVGKHRRIAREDFLVFREGFRSRRSSSLASLASQAQALDLGYE